jgi:23S rRNA pseudouridine1911/1915/1917 synthase
MAAGEVAELRIPPVRPAGPAAEPIPLDVLFEDDDIIVLNKAAGLVVHPGAGNPDGTLVNALIAHCGPSLSGVGGVGRPGIVHRLDKDTSGVLVVAKSDPAHHALSAAFADHGRSGDLERAYQALVWDVPKARGTVDAPLGRARGDRTRRAVVSAAAPDARRAVTHYTVVERFGAEPGVAALVECRLETGRTHQIRVHMAHIGHPLVGDRDYGRGFLSKANRLPATLKEKVLSFPRQALHARLLAFSHPRTHIRMRFEAPMPPDMDELVRSFRAGS